MWRRHAAQLKPEVDIEEVKTLDVQQRLRRAYDIILRAASRAKQAAGHNSYPQEEHDQSEVDND
jgi:hypothetical protein